MDEGYREQWLGKGSVVATAWDLESMQSINQKIS